MAEKQVFNFGDRDRRSVKVDRVTKENLLGRGSYKKVYGAKVEGDDREFVLSEFNDNFDAEDSTLEYKFAYQLAKFDIASVPTYIQIGKDKTLFLPTERVLSDKIKLSKGAEFLTLKLICGDDMIRALRGYPEFFKKLRELYSELIDLTKTVYTDTKVGNVCYDLTSGKIKIVDVDKQFFPNLSEELIRDYKEQYIDYMIFQTWMVEYIFVNPSLTLADAGLTPGQVIYMLQILLHTQGDFTGKKTPISNICWYSRRRFNAKFVESDFNAKGPGIMYNFIMDGNPDSNADPGTVSPLNGVPNTAAPLVSSSNTNSSFPGGRKRRTMRRKQSRKRKTRKNGKKGKK